MPALATCPRVRAVDPTTYTPFATFSCGGSTEYEQEVDQIVGMLHRGEYPAEIVRVAEDADTDSFIGLVVLHRVPFRNDPDAVYIALISLSEAWRGGWRLPDGDRLGEFLLGDALNQIKALWGPPMPTTWARVAPANTASHNVFAHWGFDLIPHVPGGYDTWYRPRGIGLLAS